MNKTIYKHFWLILFICLSATTKGQAQSSISVEERMNLEKKFRDLKTFYIDNDGTVVYTRGDNSEDNQVPAKAKQDRVKVTVNINEDGEYIVTKEQPNYSLAEEDTQLYSIPENIQIKDDFEENYREQKIQEKNPEATVENEKEPSFNQPENDSTANSKRKTLKRKEPTKTLEETALELENLISEYKKIQEQSRRKNNSLSSRLSGGVDNNIRKEYSQSLSKTDDMGEEAEEAEEIEPAYYVNGVEVSAAEFKKIKEDDIRQKERRRNGDWWVQTK